LPVAPPIARAPASPEAPAYPALERRGLINYAVPLIGVQFLYMMIVILFMNFATDVLGAAPGIVGTIFFLAKIWDAVSDPLVGHWSDRTRSRMGRRRSWLVASAGPIAIFSILLWSPPAAFQGTLLTVWIAFTVIGFYTAFTIYSVPHLALGAELSDDPIDRNRIFGARQIAITLGLFPAFAIATPLLVEVDTARTSATAIAWSAGLATAAAILVCTLWLPAEREDRAGRGARNPFVAIRDVWRNPHARLLLFVYFIEVFGMGGTSAMALYVVKYVIKASDMLGWVFAVYTLAAVGSIPLWVWLGGRYQRHRVWLGAMGIACVGYGSMGLQGEGRIALIFLSCFLVGFAGACGQTLGQAIKADVVDFDEYLTGERKEGAYFATWNFAGKLGTGLMMAIAGWSLQASGFEPNVEQTEFVRWTMLGVMGGVPFVSLLIGMITFSRFSLTREEHARIRSVVAARSGNSPRG